MVKHSYGAVGDTVSIISAKLPRPTSFGDLQYLTGLTLSAGDRGFSPATFLGKERKVKPEELPNALIPHLLIAYNRDLKSY